MRAKVITKYGIATVEYEKDEEGFYGKCISEGFTGAISEGDSEKEFLKNISEAIELVYESLHSDRK